MRRLRRGALPRVASSDDAPGKRHRLQTAAYLRGGAFLVAEKWIAGSEYKSVDIFYDEIPHKGKNVANYYIYAVFDSKTTALIRILVDTEEACERAEVHAEGMIITAEAPFANNPSGTGGVQVISDSKIKSLISGEMLAGCGLPYVLNGFYAEHEHFCRCLKNGVRPKDDAASAVQSVEISEAIRNRVPSVKF